jgi:uncharacterized protein YyaL (SSP411 family)
MPNRLVDETSPYLLQHAENPVDWQPWSAEALAEARAGNKPILLSIGYSACHWCHVMAHESFEDGATAKLMNSLFVNIKVDREERPDLDKIYQLAHQLMMRRAGGWPLTVFLSPHNHVPFFAGTYFPNEQRYGMMTFTEVLQRVADVYRDHQAEVEAQSDSMMQALEQVAAGHRHFADRALDEEPLRRARVQAEGSFEPQYGGFGPAPKFPHPSTLELLLRDWAGAQLDGLDLPRNLHMLEFTLDRMALGGIFDQLGGGFCRYSVDERWMIPHFEKMLYDNGPLLALYAQLSAVTGRQLYRETATATADWIMREMQSREGGYYSSLDADSEGEEGKFYVWDRDEVIDITGEDYALTAAAYGLEGPPNFEGRYHVHVVGDRQPLAERFGMAVDEVERRLERARSRLWDARARRVRPGRDEKVLTSWNALMIRGMTIAGRHLERQDWIDSAAQALDFLRENVWQEGRLLATCKDGKAHLAAYLDDHAFLIDAILELLQVRWRSEWLAFAQALADVLLAHFEDRELGGFYFTADDHERLLQRLKPWADEATPSGNGVACLSLARLGHLLSDTRLLTAAERGLEAVAPALREAPFAHPSLLMALDEYLHPPQIVVIRGDAATLPAWQAKAKTAYAPRLMSFAIPTDATGLPPALADKREHGGTTAYLCRGMTCSPPQTRLDALENQLAGMRIEPGSDNPGTGDQRAGP